MPVTMKDIARRAGVSIKTVSRVVNGQGEISPTTAAKVQAVIDELGYRPNQMARGLVSNRTNSLGFIVSTIRNPFYSEVAQSILHASRARNFQMVLCSHENSAQEQQRILSGLVAQGVDGVIIFPALDSTADILRFAESFSPIVAIDYEIDHPNIGLVKSNVYRGAQLAVEYLVSQGHSHIGMINAARSISHNREHGFRAAVREQGIAFSEDMIVLGDFAADDIEGGAKATTELLKRHPETTGIFCYNDLMAIGAIRAAEDLGRRVPAEMAVVGFDDIAIGEIVRPKLTTIKIDKFQAGRMAVENLLSMLDDAPMRQSTILDVTLVVRESA